MTSPAHLDAGVATGGCTESPPSGSVSSPMAACSSGAASGAGAAGRALAARKKSAVARKAEKTRLTCHVAAQGGKEGEGAQGGAGESEASGRGMVEAQTLLDFVESLPREVNLWQERVLLHRCLAFDDVRGSADANAGGQAWVQHGKALEILVRLGA